MAQLKPYEGPVAQITKVEMFFSDSAIVRVKLKAPVQNEYMNGDRIFPEGIELIFITEDGIENATLLANYAKYDRSSGIYTARGNVIVTDLKEGKKMKSEELNWNPNTKKVYTDTYVRIESADEVLTGNGLDADQDFRNYKIRSPSGVFSLKEFK